MANARYPRSWQEANQRMGDKRHLKIGRYVHLERSDDGSISLWFTRFWVTVWESIPAVTWLPDGRIVLATHSWRHWPLTRAINFALPSGYRLTYLARKLGARLIYQDRVIARFLTALVFRPEPPPAEDEVGAAEGSARSPYEGENSLRDASVGNSDAA